MVDWSGSARPRPAGTRSGRACSMPTPGRSSWPTIRREPPPGSPFERCSSPRSTGGSSSDSTSPSAIRPVPQPPPDSRATAPWRAMWDHLADAVVDDDRNRNNRFEVAAALNARISPSTGPFWACPPRLESPTLSMSKAPGFPHLTAGQLPEFRLTEQVLRSHGSYAFSVWQLLGAGSVGSQALLGIPTVAALRRPELRDRSRVWPFTTGFTRDPTEGAADAVVHAEIWPGAVSVDLTRASRARRRPGAQRVPSPRRPRSRWPAGGTVHPAAERSARRGRSRRRGMDPGAGSRAELLRALPAAAHRAEVTA